MGKDGGATKGKDVGKDGMPVDDAASTAAATDAATAGAGSGQQLSIIAPAVCPDEPEGDDTLSSGGELRRFLWSMRHVNVSDSAPQALRRFVQLRDPFATKEGAGAGVEQGK